jgi:hypothetical protein
MNVFKNVTAVWSAFISVLLKCVAGLGFATPARAAEARAARGLAAPTGSAARATVLAGTTARTTARATGTVPLPTRTPACGALLPAPRPGGRTLPPTMKQRIRAEAHGSSPSARSIAVDTGDAPPYPASPAPADQAPAAAQDDAVLVR